MKKIRLLTSILVLSGTAHAGGAVPPVGGEFPAEAFLQWAGQIPGSFASSQIALTGIGGGPITRGGLNINAEDYSFSSDNATVIEAHIAKEIMTDDGTGTMIGTGEYEPSNDMYNDKINWTIGSIAIDNAGYTSSDLKFKLDDKDFLPGTSVQTDGALTVPIVGITVTGEPSNASVIKPGQNVHVSALIFAAPGV